MLVIGHVFYTADACGTVFLLLVTTFPYTTYVADVQVQSLVRRCQGLDGVVTHEIKREKHNK